MTTRHLICLILAAGKGTRMKSMLPKVLHKVAGREMLQHVIAAANTLNPRQIRVVVGPGQEQVVENAAPHQTRLQEQQLGTGDAVRSGLSDLDLDNADVLVLYGDVPLVNADTLKSLLDQHRANDKVGVTILAMRPENPKGYGRLIIGNDGHVAGIIEELDASAEQLKINLCNSGMMIMKGEGLHDRLSRITNNNAKGEYYLTDLIAITRADGGLCAYVEGDARDLDGVNDRVQLARAETRLQSKLRDMHMRNGVTLIDPDTVYLALDTKIGNDVTIEPNVVFGSGVEIDSGVTVKSFSYLEGVTIAAEASVGPFTRIRPGTTIGKKAKVNNFVELKQTHLGARVDVSQLCCVVDSDVGDHVNIGAGTITSNYDGLEKFRTKIGDRSFIGSNSTLVAPVEIGSDAFVTAGSVITEDVPSDKLAFGRARQAVRDHTDKTSKFSKKKKGS